MDLSSLLCIYLRIAISIKLLLYIATNKYTINNRYNATIYNIRATIINSDEEAYKHLQAALDSGFEGIILRSLDDEYRFGGRGNNMIKLKSLIHSEFEILDIILKNEDSTRTYVGFKCRNDINDLTFEVTAQGDERDRQDYIRNAESYIGKKVTLGFGERTINLLPFHIKTVELREEWDMDKTDLIMEGI